MRRLVDHLILMRPMTAGIPLMEMASKNVPYLDETVPRCDGDTVIRGTGGGVCCKQQTGGMPTLLAMWV